MIFISPKNFLLFIYIIIVYIYGMGANVFHVYVISKSSRLIHYGKWFNIGWTLLVKHARLRVDEWASINVEIAAPLWKP